MPRPSGRISGDDATVAAGPDGPDGGSGAGGSSEGSVASGRDAPALAQGPEAPFDPEELPAAAVQLAQASPNSLTYRAMVEPARKASADSWDKPEEAPDEGSRAEAAGGAADFGRAEFASPRGPAEELTPRGVTRACLPVMGVGADEDDEGECPSPSHEWHFRLACFSNAVSACVCTQDGTYLVCGTGSGNVKVWDTCTWAEAARLKGFRSQEPLTLTFSPAQRWLVCAYTEALYIFECGGDWRLHHLPCAASPDERSRQVGGEVDVRGVFSTPGGEPRRRRYGRRHALGRSERHLPACTGLLWRLED
ncbi:unnamed protein product [Prorocentrum cordatum]|uniref:Uncharacterized protein n=1 Tax=Prorocentrum cordatum TaxID=2364126 RepID=A0ABN9T632_9DINO|nr:unnamed protein product [Polarella glacialis]